MEISSELEKLHLHDSLVYQIMYSVAEAKLTIHLKQCDWLEEGDGEEGYLIFNSVQQLEFDPSLDTLSWEGKNFAEVLTLEHAPAQDNEALRAVRGFLKFYYYPHQPEHQFGLGIVLSFFAKNFDWQPLS